MLIFKSNAILRNAPLSGEVLSYYNKNHNENDFFGKMTNFLSYITGILEENVTEDQISSVEDMLSDLKEQNLQIDNYLDYQKLYLILGDLEYRISVAKSKNEGYLEIPLSALKHVGNNRTKFKKSEKLSSLLYR